MGLWSPPLTETWCRCRHSSHKSSSFYLQPWWGNSVFLIGGEHHLLCSHERLGPGLSLGKWGGWRPLLGSPGLSSHLPPMLGNASLSLKKKKQKTHTKHRNHLPIKMMALGPEGKRLVKATSQMGRARAGGPCGTESQGSLCTAYLSVRRGMKPPGGNSLTEYFPQPPGPAGRGAPSPPSAPPQFSPTATSPGRILRGSWL